MRVARVLAGAAVTLAAGAAAVASAQVPAPTVGITATRTGATLATPGPLPAGPTRMEVTRSGKGARAIDLLALKPGATLEQVQQKLRTKRPESALQYANLVGGTAVGPGDKSRGFTIDLAPAVTYYVLNSSASDSKKWTVTPLATTAQLNGAALPTADADVRFVDLDFEGDTVLPRRGVVRFENAGQAPHFAVGFPLRRNAGQRAVGRALRRNQERKLGRLLNFRGTSEPQSLITAGAVNYSEVSFAKKGKYVLVCFYAGHHTQGMYRFVTVK